MAELTERIEAAVGPFVERGEVVGVVALVADREGVVAQTALGWADREARTPMRPDTLFWIASQTKPITATLLMMLVDEGRLGLDDPVAHHLPEFTGLWVLAREDEDRRELVRPERPVTVRQLLSHTGGLPFRSALEAPTLDALPLDVATRSYALTPLQTQPDTQYAYSNAGINTAGRIIEVLSGTSYEDFLQTRLLDPLGMSDTTFWPTPAQLSRLARSYQPRADGGGYDPIPIQQLRSPLDDRARRHPMPAGGLFSTAGDVARFCRMILNGGRDGSHSYVSPAALAEMTRKQTPDALPDRYGLGWSLGDDGSYGHGGAYSTSMTVHPDRGLVTVFLVQHAGWLGDGAQCRAAFESAVLGNG